MKRKIIIRKIQYALQYFPFTINTFLCIIAVWWGYKLLYIPPVKGEEPSAFMPFIILMGKMVFMFLAGLVIISILSTFYCFFYFLYLRSRKGIKLEVDFNIESKKGKNKLYLNAGLQGAIRPVLGFVNGRLYYDDSLFTDKFSLIANKRKKQSLWREAIIGRSRLNLPDIKEYNLKGGFVYFEDMLHLFSLAVAQPVNGHFYQPPVLSKQYDETVFPKKTETMDVRIEQLRRTEGEYLNYKDFEAGDDVRRIVWKVYARNRELVVRVPELFEPYASHLYFYASFYAPIKTKWLAEGYLKEMLNYYKNNVWTVYDTLSKKEWEMRYVPDQAFNIPEQLTEDEKSARIISNSNWHKENTLTHYFNAKHGTVLCITSFTDVLELKNVLEKCDAATIIYFVKLSNALKHNIPLHLIKRLVFMPPKDRLNKLRTRWAFSPIRYQIKKQEKEIELILSNSNVISGVL